MKSERRHELQHNELAEWLATSFETIKPYQNIILAAVAAILVAVLGYTLWSRDVASRTSQAWDQFNAVVQSRDPAKLAKLTEEYPNTPVGTMAAVVAADGHLQEGCDRLFVNKALAQQELTKAIELYHLVLQQTQMPLQLERATFGLALCRRPKAIWKGPRSYTAKSWRGGRTGPFSPRQTAACRISSGRRRSGSTISLPISIPSRPSPASRGRSRPST